MLGGNPVTAPQRAAQERRGAKTGGKFERERQQNKPGGEWQTTSVWQTEGGDGGEKRERTLP